MRTVCQFFSAAGLGMALFAAMTGDGAWVAAGWAMACYFRVLGRDVACSADELAKLKAERAE